jgi:hypothetical protein
MKKIYRTSLMAVGLGIGWQVRSQEFEPPAPPPPAAQPKIHTLAPRLRVPPPAPHRGVIGGVPGGISGGVIGGVPGGVSAVAPEPPEPPEPALAAEGEAPEAPEPPEIPEPVMAVPQFRELDSLAFAQTPPPQPPKPARTGEDERLYERAQRDLERNRWDPALENFSEVASRGGSRADAALYWKAYALNKLGRRDDALAALAALRKTYASSRWLDDAKALDVEIRQASGKPVSPEAAGDEELKLMALNGLMSSDPERALPLLEKLLHSSQSPKVKERALFVLTQSDSPRARQMVVSMAKGTTNPDLQMKAVHYLGVMGAQKQLAEVYASAADVEVKRAVLHGLMVGGAQDQLLAVAKGEKNPDLRRDAIHWLGTMGAEPELWQMYQSEQSPELKRSIVHALFIGGKTDHLIEIARTAKEPEVRQDAIHWLGASGSHKAGDALAAMYQNESDTNVKKQIVHALFIQNNGRALVEIARKENNMELKKDIVHWLSVSKSKEGTEYLLELLNK